MSRVSLGFVAAIGLLLAYPFSDLSARGKKDEDKTTFVVIGDFASAEQNKKGKKAEEVVAAGHPLRAQNQEGQTNARLGT